MILAPIVLGLTLAGAAADERSLERVGGWIIPIRDRATYTLAVSVR